MRFNAQLILFAALTATAVTGPALASASTSDNQVAKTPTAQHRFDFGSADPKTRATLTDPAHAAGHRPHTGRFDGESFRVGPKPDHGATAPKVVHTPHHNKRFDFRHAS